MNSLDYHYYGEESEADSEDGDDYSDYDWYADQGYFDSAGYQAGYEYVGDGLWYDPSDGSIYDEAADEWYFPDQSGDAGADESADQPETISYQDFLDQQAAREAAERASQPDQPRITYEEYLDELWRNNRDEWNRLVDPYPWGSMDPQFNQDPRSQGPLDASYSNTHVPTLGDFIAAVRPPGYDDPPPRLNPVPGQTEYFPANPPPDHEDNPFITPPLPPKPTFEAPEPLPPIALPPKTPFTPPPIPNRPTLPPPLPPKDFDDNPFVTAPPPVIIAPPETTAPPADSAENGDEGRPGTPVIPKPIPNANSGASSSSGLLFAAGLLAVVFLASSSRGKTARD